MFQVTPDSNPRAGKPGDFRIRSVPDERFGDECDHHGGHGLALYYTETRGGSRFSGRRACSEHAGRWWERKTKPRMKAPKKVPKPVGRPPSEERRERLHVTLGELSLEILASHQVAAAGGGEKFNASQYFDEAIRFAQASPAFQERLKKH